MKGLGGILSAVRSLEEPSALATLVRTRGSSYRLPGARMLFHQGGLQTGGISAGCMETDVKARVAEVLGGRHPTVVTFDLGSELDLIWGTGMGCAGRADVLLERVEPGAQPPWMAAAAGLLEARRPCVLITVFAARGAGPASAGDRYLVEGDRHLLAVPEGLLPHLAKAIEQAGGSPRACTLRAGDQELDLLVEPLVPPVALWIYGAGEHSQPLFRLAKELGWFLGLVDHRPALATPERFPEADRILVGHPPEVLDGLVLDGRSAALVVSHVYEADKAAVAAFLGQPLGYLGMQGNRKRSERILKELAEERGPLSAHQEAVLHHPAGLDLGSEAPELIALSMLSEIQAVLARRSGRSLREGKGSIH